MKQKPQFKKLNTNTIIDKLVATLPPKLKKGVKFAYTKHETLFFVLNHPIYKMEFEYNKQDIKALLKIVKLDDIKDVAFFVSNVVEKKNEKKEDLTPAYPERSNAYFDNNVKNKKIHKVFEEIREIIRDNKKL